MARRRNTDNGPSAAEKTTHKTSKQAVKNTSEQAVENTTEQAVEGIVERIAERAVEKVLDRIASKGADQFLEKIASEIVGDIAARVTDKIAAGIAGKLAGNTSDEPTADNTPDEAANKFSDETAKKARAETEDSASEDRPLRRSGRQATASAAGSKRQSPEVEELPPPKRTRTMSEPEQRRNPKRKASEEVNNQARETTVLSENLLEEALKPLSAADIQEWDGWAEVESEPRLGVPGIKATELLAAEQWALDFLQKPVFGLIFLFQYAPHLEDEDDDEEEEAPIWFANQVSSAPSSLSDALADFDTQTTNNSCASVAILNIVMNADDAELGEQLRAFKESTRDLSTPLRGHRIGSDGFIRAAHNSFVRRVDQLNTDLCLANEADAARLKPARKRAVPKKGRKQHQAVTSKKKKPSADYGFHFIAYVPAGGHVWELDGMRIKPRKIGALVPDEDWTSIARPRIQGRMQQYQESENGFSLLALCRSPLVAHRNAIASAVAEMLHVRSKKQHDAQFVDVISADEPVIDIENSAELCEFGLEKSDVINAHVPESNKARISEPDFDAGKAYSRYSELVAEARSAMGTYRQAIIDVADEEKRVKAREKDYTPALHCWMKKLAEKGVLEDVIKTSR
ncbi:Ubiquitin carboxyl-terminal hydrolase isozyme L5 [Tolypocladium ophioglossoides CBS 100239]|uniref:ubiquitinyl hydrolase 1 n=1 Tax=Tolypocladium ophioglossoides (strain CBS 100239) TaxID=1163406 RepID=A0A0L0NGD9_TOLOC|nr:Ubiquitin carboxyl-terminal hydrolase isozyme L5 [Tolypocladium ophioglossoides CBS 100239]